MSDLPLNTIIQGDCLDVMRGWPDNCVEAVVTDPPYNIGYGYDVYADNLDDEDYYRWQLAVVDECARLLRPSGSVLYLQYPEFASRMFWAAHESTVLTGHKLIAWIYHPHTGGIPLRKGTRLWAWLSKGDPFYNMDATYGQYRNPDDPRIRVRIEDGQRPIDYDWWCYEQVKNVSLEKTAHPCQLPEQMIRRVVSLVTPKGGTVLDPFCGSGTTCVAAKREGFDYIGIDISPEYCEIARRRVAATEKNLFASSGG